jgi:hypothetical protein
MSVNADTWTQSSACSDNACVEVGMWKKSSHSPLGDECVEVAGGVNLEEILVRDTKDNGNGPVLHFSKGEWVAFVDGVKAGEFDLA